MQDSQQAQHRQHADSQHAMAGLQAQLKQAAREVEVLRAGAGHAQEQALAALKVIASDRCHHAKTRAQHLCMTYTIVSWFCYCTAGRSCGPHILNAMDETSN